MSEEHLWNERGSLTNTIFLQPLSIVVEQPGAHKMEGGLFKQDRMLFQSISVE